MDKKSNIRAIHKNVREEDSELARKWKAKKQRQRTTVIVILIAIAVIVIAAFLVKRFYKYSEYELRSEITLSEGSFAGCEAYLDNMIKYSHDGAAYYDISGEEVWVDSYEMKNPGICVSGDYVCIADRDNTQINIYDSTGLIGTANTIYPITKAVIAESGVVSAIVEDDKASYITFYKKDGEELDITVKSLLSGDGYPVDLSLSPEGTSIIVSYAYIESGTMKTRVVFYDFSEIGKNIPNRLVGGFEEPFENSFVADVEFLNDTYSYAAADTGIYFFSSRNIASPELVKEIPYDGEISSVFTAGENVGVIAEDSSSSNARKLIVYKPDGGVLFEEEVDFDYDSVGGDEDGIYISGNNRLVILSYNGVRKYDGEMSDSATVIRKSKVPGRYVFSGASYIRQYQFR